MKKMIMKKSLLVLLLALMTSVPMLAVIDPVVYDVAINETNFPDANFRNYVKETIMGDASATTLTAEKIYDTFEIWIPDVQIANLKGIEYFAYLRSFACSGVQTFEISDELNNLSMMSLQGSFTSFENHNIPRCGILSIDAPLTSLTLTPQNSHVLGPYILHLRNIKLTTLDLSNCAVLYLGVYDTDVQFDLILHPYNRVITLNNTKQTSLDLSGLTGLQEVSLQNNSNLCTLTLPSNKSRLTDIVINGNPSLTSLNVDDCSALKHLSYTGNGFKSVNVSNNAALEVLKCNNNELTSLNVSNNTTLKFLYCQDNLLTSLNLSNNTDLRGLNCSNNKLTELKLSKNPKLKTEFAEESDFYKTKSDTMLTYTREYYGGEHGVAKVEIHGSKILDTWHYYPSINLSPQTLSKDYVAIDGRDKLGVKCNTNNGVLTSYGTYSAVTSSDDDNNYIVVGNGTTDVHGYNNPLSYNYNTGYTGDYDEAKTMEVNIGTSAHGMYIHPETLRGSDNFYSGTLYLEFPAKIPEGVQCYYAKGLDANEDLVGLTEVTGTIPANTAVIVKAPNEYKFFAFNESDETPAAPTDNIIEGTIEGLSVAPGTVLTLGHNVDRSTGEYDNFGFWNYRGNWINPFRAYIPKSSLTAGAKNGFSLVFPEDGTTGIARLTNSDTAEDGTWYTLSGMRLTAKPTAKGIYVNGGKKVVIK